MKNITLILSLFILSGCQLTQVCDRMPRLPVKPTLPSIRENSEGGITLNKEDSAKLGQYILELERGYK